MRNTVIAQLLLLAFFVGPRAAVAQAPSECINPPIFLPGIGGPPQWSNAGTDPCQGTQTCKRPDDPRWAAGAERGVSSSVALGADQPGLDPALNTDQISVRFVRSADSSALYVLVRCLMGLDACGAFDSVFVGLTVGANSAVHKFVVPNLGACDPETSVCYTSLTSSCSCAVAGTASCVDASDELLCTAPAPTFTPSPPAVWKTPRGWSMAIGFAGVTGLARAFVGAKVELPGGDTAVLPACTNGSSCWEDVVPNSPYNWPQVDLNCSNLIELDSSRVGIRGSDSCAAPAFGSVISTASGVQNKLGACPSCPSGLASSCRAANAITTRFRIADWGTIAGAGTWRDYGVGRTTASSQGMVAFNCTVGTDCVARTSSVAHQCMLVEAMSGGSSALRFSRPAVYRNMIWGTASRLEETATLEIARKSIAEALGVSPQAIYLYLQKENMPGVDLPSLSPSDPRRGRKLELPMKSLEALRSSVEDGSYPPVPAQYLEKEHPPGVFRLHSSDEVLDAAWPTLKVHAFMDLGLTTMMQGREQKLLYPLPSFGIRVAHEGELYGFATTVGSGDAVAFKSGDSFSLPIDQTRDSVTLHVPVEIEAVEEKPVPCTCGRCEAAPRDGEAPRGPWALAGLALLLLWRTRSRSRA